MIISDAYVKECREAALPRKLRAGDYMINFWDDFTQCEIRLVEEAQVAWLPPVPDLKERGGSVWAPRVDDLLDLIDAEGADVITMMDKARLAIAAQTVGIAWVASARGGDRVHALLRLLRVLRATRGAGGVRAVSAT